MTHTRTVIAFLTLLVAAQIAPAATLDVCATGCSYTSIQAAIDAASAGDVIELERETFDEGEIDVDKNLTIRSASGMATVDGDLDDYVFFVKSGAVVTFEDLKLIGGTDCRLKNAGQTTLSTVYVMGTGPNDPSTYGGMLNQVSGTLSLDDYSVVSANASTNYGGGITNFGDLVVALSTVTANEGKNGGGVMNSDGTVSVLTSSFSFNNATNKGGAWANTYSSGSFAFHSSASYSGNTADGSCDKYWDIGETPSCVN
ncbi:MAG: hypothetical protein AAGD38_02815 [Acidobacteriota bacterium]